MAALRDFAFAQPSKDWARKILRREASGEHLPPICGEFAREALGMTVIREPGDDDDA